ncbi:MAG: hypothetical protein KF851_08555 [Pirellulaceae bacterium]|nr:hypothetical protein [Pirellulaceae bacterium]
MATESITVVKADGTSNGPYKATFSKNIMRVFGENVNVDDGDSIERPLPNGKIEMYTVEEATFVRGMSDAADNWKMIVRKDTSLRPKGGGKTTNINIHNSQGIQIGDYNVQHVQSVIESMISAIEDSDASDEEKTEAKSRLQAFLSHPLVTATLGAAAGALIKAAAT